MTEPKPQTLAAFLLSFLFVFSLAYFSGALFSGWQLTEDYQYLDTHERMAKGETWEIILNRYFHEDSKRIRLVWPLFVLQTEIFGTHIHLIRAVHVTMGALAIFFLYLFGRTIGFGFLESLLLGILSMTGPHFYVWWRMQTQENICFFFLALGLWAGAKRKDWLFVFAIAMMSWHKESFMVIVPAVMFMRVWLTKESHWAPLAALALSLTVQMLLILFVTGTIAGGYVGYDGLFMDKILHAAKQLSKAAHPQVFAALLVVAIFSVRKIYKDREFILARLGPLVLFFLAFTLPQVLLFQKTGIDKHYVLPGVFAFWFAFFYLYHLLKNKLGILQRLVLLAVIGQLAFTQTSLAFQSGVAFKKEGAMVAGIIERVKNGTQPEDPVLMVVDPGRHLEWSWAAKRYLESFAKRPNLWMMPIIRPNYSEREKFLTYESHLSPLKVYKGRLLRDLPDPGTLRAIVVFPTAEIWFLVFSRGWFNKYEYDRTTTGIFAVYTKKSGV